MPEIVVVSGKGGTGKTSLTAAFAHLADDAIICDLDVDAPDLHLLLHPQRRQTLEFYAGYEASVQPRQCEDCGICRQMCMFDAIGSADGHVKIDPLKCEGCGVCVQFCPADAIDFTEKHCGEWHLSDTRFGTMFHARLIPGEENSGRLVALLRQKAREMAKERDAELIIADGPPGIGCPVISALTGADLAVIVTEPTPSGLHDFDRIATLCDHFNIPVAVIINKADLNPRIAGQIEDHCRQWGHQVVARLPHDPVFVHAMVHGQTVTEYECGGMCTDIEQAWNRIASLAGCGPTASCSREANHMIGQ